MTENIKTNQAPKPLFSVIVSICMVLSGFQGSLSAQNKMKLSTSETLAQLKIEKGFIFMFLFKKEEKTQEIENDILGFLKTNKFI